MHGAPDDHVMDPMRGVTRWVKHRSLGKKRSQRFCLDYRGGRIPESSGTGGFEIRVRFPLARLCRHQSACPGSQDCGMIIPSSGNYHVSDSINWCGSSCPSLVGPRTAKRRGIEKEIDTRRNGWFAESAGRLSFRLILVANVYEKSIF